MADEALAASTAAKLGILPATAGTHRVVEEAGTEAMVEIVVIG